MEAVRQLVSKPLILALIFSASLLIHPSQSQASFEDMANQINAELAACGSAGNEFNYLACVMGVLGRRRHPSAVDFKLLGKMQMNHLVQTFTPLSSIIKILRLFGFSITIGYPASASECPQCPEILEPIFEAFRMFPEDGEFDSVMATAALSTLIETLTEEGFAFEIAARITIEETGEELIFPLELPETSTVEQLPAIPIYQEEDHEPTSGGQPEDRLMISR